MVKSKNPALAAMRSGLAGSGITGPFLNSPAKSYLSRGVCIFLFRERREHRDPDRLLRQRRIGLYLNAVVLAVVDQLFSDNIMEDIQSGLQPAQYRYFFSSSRLWMLLLDANGTGAPGANIFSISLPCVQITAGYRPEPGRGQCNPDPDGQGFSECSVYVAQALGGIPDFGSDKQVLFSGNAAFGDPLPTLSFL